jgi:hypothetical protein
MMHRTSHFAVFAMIAVTSNFHGTGLKSLQAIRKPMLTNQSKRTDTAKAAPRIYSHDGRLSNHNIGLGLAERGRGRHSPLRD